MYHTTLSSLVYDQILTGYGPSDLISPSFPLSIPQLEHSHFFPVFLSRSFNPSIPQ
jgi:hypothetical protein